MLARSSWSRGPAQSERKVNVSSGFLRFSTRIAMAVLIPAAVIVWLIYSAAQQQSYIEARNMRWLGQMATQIYNLVRNQERIVRDSSPDELRIAENLTTEDNPGDTINLGVYDKGNGPKLYFRQPGPEREPRVAFADLTRLVDRTLRPGVFDTVILARRNGTVLYQSNPGTLRLTNVQFLFAPVQESSKLGMLLGGEKGDPKAAPGTPSAPTSTMHVTRSIGDRMYSVSVQPIRLLVPNTGKEGDEGDWLLMGLTEKSADWRKATPNSVVIILPLVLLLVAVCWPLPRPWHLNPSEPFRGRDLTLIAACTMMVLAILTVLGIFHSTRVLADARTEQRLTLLAGSIGENLKHELTLIIRQMRAFDDEAAARTPFESDSSILSKMPASRAHTLFEYVDWMNRQGDKTVRWSLRDAPARKLNVADRGYFRAVMADRLSTLTLPDGHTERFTIEQVLSRTTNRSVTIVATKSRLKETPAMSAGVRPLSVQSVALPRDFGFAIFEGDGRVIFHSEPGRALVENFFEETEDAPELRSASERRVPAVVDSNYGGTAHRLMITPIPGLEQVPWTLAVFRSLEPIRSNRVQSLAGTVALFLSYAAILAAIWLLVLFVLPAFRHRVVPRTVFDLTWWSRGTSSYPAVAAVGLVVLLVMWRAIHRVEGAGLFYVAVATGLAFLTISAIGLRRSRRLSASPRTAGWLAGMAATTAALAFVAGDWLMVVAAPAIAFVAAIVLLRMAYGGRSGAARRLQTAGWMAWTVELGLCVVVAPAFLVGQMAWQFESGLYVRDLQWNLQQDDDVRRRQLTREIEAVPGVKENPAIRMKLLRATGLIAEEACPPVYLYGAPGFNTLTWPLEESAEDRQACGNGECPAGPPCVASVRNARVVPPTEEPPAGFWHKLEAGFPSFVLASVEVPLEGRRRGYSMRLGEMKPAGNLWKWYRSGGSQERLLWLVRGTTVVARSTAPGFVPLDLLSPAHWRQQHVLELWIAFQFWLGLAAVCALLLWWMLRLVSRVLLLDMGNGRAPETFDAARDSGRSRLLLLAQPGSAWQGIPEWANGFTEVDFAALGGEGADVPAGPLFFRHLETRFGEEAARLTRLGLLEAALRDSNRRIVILSTIDPVHYLATGGAGALGDPASEPEQARWRRVMSYFRTCWLPAKTAGRDFSDYSLLWESCSYEEKLLLSYLDRHKMVNPMAWPLVRELLARSIIRRRPSLRFDFSSSGFQDFVRAQQMKPYVAEGAPAATWRLPPYAIGLVLFGVVLFFSQEEITSRLIGFLTTLTGGYEAIRRQFAASADPAKSKK